MTSDLIKKLKGQYIAIDGPDGSGKSTIVSMLADECDALEDVLPVCISEPGSTEYGQRIRQMLLADDVVDEVLDTRAEVMLFMAARAQMAVCKIEPYRKLKFTIFSDRCVASTYAYQGIAGGVKWTDIAAIYDFSVPQALRPDLTIILDVDVATSRERLAKKSAHPDRIEKFSDSYHSKVRDGYLQYAQSFSANTRLVTAAGDIGETCEAVVDAIKGYYDMLAV